MITNKADVLKSILKELSRAEELHPGWPSDILHGIVIIGEEFGEATKATYEFVYENKSLSAVQEELIQTAAMCVRMLCNLHTYNTKDGESENHDSK